MARFSCNHKHSHPRATYRLTGIVVRVERRVYVEGPGEEYEHWRRVDAAIVMTEQGGPLVAGTATATMSAPAECLIAMPLEQRETYLVIRERKNMEVVTVIDTLSPANKRGGDGRCEYLAKRQEVLSSQAHLVELDLLRGGERMPMTTPLPPARGSVRVDVALPTIPIPLRKGDDDALLDLQSAFSTVYARARYDLSVQYDAELDPPPSEGEAEWIQSRRKARS